MFIKLLLGRDALTDEPKGKLGRFPCKCNMQLIHVGFAYAIATGPCRYFRFRSLAYFRFSWNSSHSIKVDVFLALTLQITTTASNAGFTAKSWNASFKIYFALALRRANYKIIRAKSMNRYQWTSTLFSAMSSDRDCLNALPLRFLLGSQSKKKSRR